MQTSENKIQQVAALGGYPVSRFAYAACATPPGTSGIAVIRMSGTAAFEIANPLFRNYSSAPDTVLDMKGYTCAYGDFIDPVTKETIDSVILTKFVAPHSYTGEDTIEISCHGGQAVKTAILRVLFSQGARPAEPGEFTRHAFLNGKLDLAQAEAVMDLISASARKAGDEASRQLKGVLSEKVREISGDIYKVMSQVEMILEFPEHEETAEASQSIKQQLMSIRDRLDILMKSFHKGRILKEGLSVVIAGKPNAGKSSMLNTLAGYDRAIVTDIPGTTRDTIEEFVDVEGLPVRLVDTAGLRESSDKVEQIGIDRARRAIETADLVFWIASETQTDPEHVLDQEEDLREILSCHQEKSLAIIIGKSDLVPYEKNRKVFEEKFPGVPVIPFSSVTREGMDEAVKLIWKKYEETGSAGSEEVLITNERHFHAVMKAKECMDLALQSISDNMPLDLQATVLRGAADRLAEITGDEVTEELVNEIFSRFCVGK